MIIYLAAAAAFFLALLASFFKCVEEDAQGKRVTWRLGLPKPTKAGVVISFLLLLSFAFSLVTTYGSRRGEREAKQQQRALEERVVNLQEVNQQAFEAIVALSRAIETVRSELNTVRNQNSAMLKFAKDNLTKEQAGELFQASVKAVLQTVNIPPPAVGNEVLIDGVRVIHKRLDDAWQKYDNKATLRGFSLPYRDTHPGEMAKVKTDAQQQYESDLVPIIDAAKILRLQILQRLGPETDEDKKWDEIFRTRPTSDFRNLPSIADAGLGNYLEKLAKRLSP